MINSRNEYFRKIGFKADPFASTNALQEEMLEEYFVVPPYYYSLVGTIQSPKSSFVIAPRGTGKTAQRVMLEKMAEKEKGMIAVVYDEFPVEKKTNVKDITVEDHLKRIMKNLIIAFLTELNNSVNVQLSAYDKVQLRKLIELYLSGINSEDIERTINKIKGISGKLEELWCKAGKTINSIINMILKKNNMCGIELISDVRLEKYSMEEMNSHFDYIETLFRKIGIFSVFVLVDSIDETVITGNNAEKSYYLIRPFILDLRLLERKTVVFKFFVWDKIVEYWSEEYRIDRIEIFQIKWNREEIRELLSKRLKAFSENRYMSLKDVLDCDDKYIEYIYYFANNSPRDVINIMKSIYDEHLRISDPEGKKPDEQAVILGIETFCKNKFEEMVTNEKQRAQLKRIKLATFTIPYLYNDVYKCEAGGARNILMPWLQAGIVYSGTNRFKVPKSNVPINVYTFGDIRVARYVCSNQKLEEFVQRNMMICPECGMVNIFDKQNKYGISQWQCKNCMTELLGVEATNVDNGTKLKMGKNHRLRNDEVEGQISLFDFFK